MEIEYQLSKKDYFESSKLYLRNLLQQRIWVFILLTLFLIATFNGETFLWWRFLIAIVVSPLVIIVMAYFIPLFIVQIRLNNATAKDKSTFESKKVTINDEGLLVESESKTQMRKWESIVSAWSNDKFVYLVLADKKFSPVPKSAFSSETEAINFLGLVQSKIIQKRGVVVFPNSNIVGKPSYRIGLLCLIPLIGAVAGIVFIINGIFKYKDKWFVVIGVAGIIWTVVVYSSLFFSNIWGHKELFVDESKIHLNNLMKDIEFYKIKNGSYPDSLEQISKDDPGAWIYDPIQSGFNNSELIKFNYRKIGSHYYLFSSGIDGIPNTQDDIYPQVAKLDSAKFGLIGKSY